MLHLDSFEPCERFPMDVPENNQKQEQGYGDPRSKPSETKNPTSSRNQRAQESSAPATCSAQGTRAAAEPGSGAASATGDGYARTAGGRSTAAKGTEVWRAKTHMKSSDAKADKNRKKKAKRHVQSQRGAPDE